MQKFNNHGLDAINSRVCMPSLDDFVDEEPVQNIIHRQVQHPDYTGEYLMLNYPFNNLSETIEEFLKKYQDYNTEVNGDYIKLEEKIRAELKIEDLREVKDIIDFETLLYMYCIIARGDIARLSNISEAKDKKIEYDTFSDYNWMLTLMKRISILLVDSKNMPEHPIKGDYPTESLGCYFSIGQFDYPQPAIFLCPEKIEEAARNKYIDKKVLYSKVLIHELAHAIMDPTNIFENGTLKSKVSEQKLVSDADVFMEESLANMITLQYFEAAKSIIGEKDFEQVKSFMEKQPEAYKFGITQYEKLHTDWRVWRNNKSQMAFWNYWAGIINIEIG